MEVFDAKLTILIITIYYAQFGAKQIDVPYLCLLDLFDIRLAKDLFCA